MKKINKNKREVKKIKKTEALMVNKRRKKSEPDLWKEIQSSVKEIRTNLKPIGRVYNKFGKAYNKLKDKRRSAKQKEEERRLKEKEKQRLIEEENIRLQEQEEKRFKKERRLKEDKERRLKVQGKQRVEEKRLIEERDEQTRQADIYKQRLIKGEEERIIQLHRVDELREAERKLIDQRNLKIESRFADQQRLKEAEQQRLKEEEQRLKGEEQRLKGEEQRLKGEEQRLKEVEQQRLKEAQQQKVKKDEEQELKEAEKTNLKEERKFDDEQKKKRLNGTIKWYNGAKGYGFIKRDDQEQDIFVHSSAVKNSGLKHLKEGEQFTFEVERSDKGPSAVNLEKTVNEVFHSHLKVVK